ncbi:MAG: glycosyltransferase [Rickettsiales bacterium]|jgi:glycosyltransferase involved in cell wall biosynthesis|nr:glycosyltransferase [Rickettsiales bacterium]
MKKQPKVSIVVPIYNVEKYLNECLDSIVNQTLKEIEIILVNDGSTDSSLDIITSYADKDNRIVVINKPNEGYGKTMNRGFDAATGEYIGIVESDDWAEPDMFQELYKTAKENDADVVKADFVFFDSDTGKESESWDYGIQKKLHNKIFTPMEYPEIIWTGHPSIWTAIYRTDMVRKKNVRFPETPGASFQDMGFKPKSLIPAQRFYFLPKVLLHYRKHANNSDKNNNKIFAVCDSHHDTDAWAKNNMPGSKRLTQILNRSKLNNYLWNSGRLSGAPKQEFKAAFGTEFKPVYENNAIYMDGLSARDILRLKKIIYPKSLWVKLQYFAVLISRLFFKTKTTQDEKAYKILCGLITIHIAK